MMTYDEVQVGQRVTISGARKGHARNGTVHAKEIVHVAGRPVERIYVNTDNKGRSLCAPSVLRLEEPVDV